MAAGIFLSEISIYDQIIYFCNVGKTFKKGDTKTSFFGMRAPEWLSISQIAGYFDQHDLLNQLLDPFRFLHKKKDSGKEPTATIYLDKFGQG